MIAVAGRADVAVGRVAAAAVEPGRMAQLVVVWGRLLRRVVAAVRADPEFRGVAVGAVAILAVGTVFYSLHEGWSALDALYFSTTTLTTVGLGDYTPDTTLGKWFTIAYVLSGVGLILAFVERLVRPPDRDTPRNDETPGAPGVS